MKTDRSQHVWLMDDDATFNFIHTHLIESANPNVKIIPFISPTNFLESFINAAEAQLPNHILLDINMPEMNGFELLDKLLKIDKFNRKSIRVYIVSSTMNPSDVKKAKTYESVEQLLVKPITPQQIEGIFAAE